MFILVAESDPEEDGERGEEDERGVEEDVPGLGHQTVFKGDEEGSEKGGGGAAVERAKSEVGEGDGGDAESRWEHAHGDVGYVLVDPVYCEGDERLYRCRYALSNVLEVKVSVISK